jgi:hypothetical protein
LRGKRPINVGIRRDDHFIAQAEQAALAFWKLVQDKTPPKMIDGRDTVVYDSLQPDSVWEVRAEEYKEKKVRYDSLKAQVDAIKKDLKTLESDFTDEIPEGQKTFVKEGIRATKVEREGNISTQDLIEIIENELNVKIPQDMIDKARGNGSSYFKITVDENAEKVEVEQKPLETITEPEASETPTETITGPIMASIKEDPALKQMSTSQATTQEVPKEPTEFIQPVMPRNDYFEKSSRNMHF